MTTPHGAMETSARDVRSYARAMRADDWEARVASVWADDRMAATARIHAMEQLALDAPHPAIAEFELAGAYDAADDEPQAHDHYVAATADGLADVDPARGAQLLVQHASTLRNLGRLDEAIAMLASAPRHPSTGSAPAAFLAFALHDAGRHADAIRVLIDELAPTLPRYRRAVLAYVAELADPPVPHAGQPRAPEGAGDVPSA